MKDNAISILAIVISLASIGLSIYNGRERERMWDKYVHSLPSFTTHRGLYEDGYTVTAEGDEVGTYYAVACPPVPWWCSVLETKSCKAPTNEQIKAGECP
jgi:hypothetical protein